MRPVASTISDTRKEESTGPLAHITSLAARTLGAPIALLFRVQGEKRWIASHEGLTDAERSAALAFYDLAVSAEPRATTPDLAIDPAFVDNALVHGPRRVRVIFGVALRARAGPLLGALAVVDTRTRELTGEEAATLQSLAELAVLALERASTNVTAIREVVGEAPDVIYKEQFQLLAEASREGVAVHEDGNIRFVNHAFATMFGYVPDELVGKSILELTAESSHAATVQAVSQGTALSCEYMGQKRDGSEFPMEVMGRTIMYQGRRVRVATIRDMTGYKQALEAARASEIRLRSVTDSVRDAIITANAAGVVVGWNRGAQGTFGHTAAEITGEPLTSLMPERYRAAHRGGLAHYLKTGKGQVVGTTVELHGLRKDGSEFPCELSLGSWTSGDEVFFTGIVRDISERRRAAEDRRWLAAIVDSSEDAIIGRSLSGNIASFNRAAELLTGYQARDVLGKDISLVLPSHATTDNGETTDATVLGVGVSSRAATIRHRVDELPIDVTLTISPVHDEAGQLVGASLIARDNREKLRAERAVLASERRFRALTAHVPVGLFETDAQGDCLFVNQRWTDLTGLSIDEAAGSGWTGAIHPDDRARVSHEWYAAAREEREFQLEYRYLTAKGATWVWGAAIALRDLSGGVTGYLGTAVDITERRLTEEKTRRSLHEKEVLLQEIHHRVKNNLQVVSSLLNLQGRHVRDPATRAAFEDSQKRVHSIALLHEKLYQSDDLGRIDFGDYLRTLVAAIAHMQNLRKPVKVSVKADGFFLDITSAVPCGLIVNELLTNSFKHAFADTLDPTIEVSMRRMGEDVFLEVDDNGSGMSLGSDGDDRATMGLHLVRTLARQIDGKVDRSPDTAHPGTKWVVAFPAHILQESRGA